MKQFGKSTSTDSSRKRASVCLIPKFVPDHLGQLGIARSSKGHFLESLDRCQDALPLLACGC